jgi:hypothetical protein
MDLREAYEAFNSAVKTLDVDNLDDGELRQYLKADTPTLYEIKFAMASLHDVVQFAVERRVSAAPARCHPTLSQRAKRSPILKLNKFERP